MTEELTRIPFGEFSENLAVIFERVVHEHTSILVESDAGDLIEVKPAVAKPRRRAKSEEDYKAFLASFGGWNEVDVDSFLKESYESRNISTRPPVEL